MIEAICGAACCMTLCAVLALLLGGALRRGRPADVAAMPPSDPTYGVTRFVWSTCGDEHVCVECRALDGRVFEHANPPPHGLPGERPGCRCSALAVIDARDERDADAGDPATRRRTCSDPLPKRKRRKRPAKT